MSAAIGRTRKLRSNIWKFYILRIFSKRMVWPILTIFLVRNSLTATEIGIVYAVGTIIGLVLEVPSGAISDKIGERKAIMLAFMGWAVSMFIFWQGHSFWAYLAAQSVYMAAGSFFSGTADAFLYDTLSELGETGRLKKIWGRTIAISQLSVGVLFIVIPVIASYSFSLPFLINFAVFIIAALFVSTLVEPRRTTAPPLAHVAKDLLGFRTFMRVPVLLAIGLAFGSIGGINGILGDFRQIYLDAIHFNLVYFGFVYLALRIFMSLGATLIDRIERAIGKRMAYWLLPLISLITYVGLALINSFYGLIFIALDGLQEGFSKPLEQEYMNAAIKDGNKRVTMLSIFNLIHNLIHAGAVFAGGIVIDHYGINSAFAMASVLVLVVIVPASMWFMRQARSAGLLSVPPSSATLPSDVPEV